MGALVDGGIDFEGNLGINAGLLNFICPFKQ
jgi:hypothetical protein